MIKAKIAAQNKQANLRSYDEAYRSFSWSEVEKSFAWSETGKLNIVHEAIDRWAGYEEKKDIPAMIFESGGKATTYSYFDLKRISCQWAHLLKQYGFEKGDRLFIFLTPCPQVYFAMLACARLGVVFCPLFSTLNFDELEERLESAKPRAVLTHPDLGERLSRDAMDGVDHVFYTQGPGAGLVQRRSRAGGTARNHAGAYGAPMAFRRSPPVSSVHIGLHRPAQGRGARPWRHGRTPGHGKVRA